MPLKDRAMSKLTPKQQKFVYKYLETGNAAESYRHAYDTKNWSVDSINVEASRMLNHPKISLIIKAEQEKAQQRHEVTLESITKELEEARVLGMTEKQTAAAISASLGKAKLHGLVVDKSQLSNDPDNPVNWNVTVNIPDADKH